MKKNPQHKIIWIMRRAPILLSISLILLIVSHRDEITIQSILAYSPRNPIKAACVLLLLYALKSVSIVFPGIILQIAAGHLFSNDAALAINFLGMVVCLTVPYGIGRLSGSELINWLKKRFPTFQKWLALQQGNSFFICFFLRITSCLPGDVVGMYLGATQTPFLRYLVAGILGILPGMIFATLLGESISDPNSTLFLISISVTVALSILSFLVYYCYLHRKQKT